MFKLTSLFNPAERIIYFAVALAIAAGCWFGYSDPVFFTSNYAREDGAIEWLTTLSLLVGAVISFTRLLKLRSQRSSRFVAVLALSSLVFFFGAGEEISWGQRIFGMETPLALKEINSQGEINLHNIQVGNFKVNKVIFSQLLGLSLLIYLLVLPTIYSGSSSAQKLTDGLGIPVPRWSQVLFFILCALAVSTIHNERKWELMEFCGGMCFVTMLAFPRNQGIFFSK